MSITNKQWFAQESKTRYGGTARSVGGSAITGHAKAKTGVTGPARKGALGAAGSTATVGKPVKASATMLSVLNDKSDKFE